MDYFKKCPCCGFVWDSWGIFMTDPDVFYIGKSAFRDYTIFLFIHASCGTTLSLSADKLDEYFILVNKRFKKPDPRLKVGKK